MKPMRVAVGLAMMLGGHTSPLQAQPAAATNAAAPPIAPVASPRVVMLRVYVADIDRAEHFYQDVFGMKVMQKYGEDVRIMIFPGGAYPGIILIKSPDEVRMNGSWVMQVANVQETLAKAKAGGGKLMNTKFEQDIGGMPANSSHLIDPDGNIIEVLQVGSADHK